MTQKNETFVVGASPIDVIITNHQNPLKGEGKKGKWVGLTLRHDGIEKILFISQDEYDNIKQVINDNAGYVALSYPMDKGLTATKTKNIDKVIKKNKYKSQDDKIKEGNAKNVAGLVYAAHMQITKKPFNIKEFSKIVEDIYNINIE